MKQLIQSILFLSLFFASCAKDEGQPGQSGSRTTGRTIRKEVSLQVAPMQGTEGEGTTRAATQVPLSEDEAKIHSLWVLQFNIMDGKLIKKTKVDVSGINPVTGAFYFDFEELENGGQIEVWLLANFDDGEYGFPFDGLVENTTTLSEFENLCYTNGNLTEDYMKTRGLPMVASQILNVATANPAPFKLKSLLAKVIFSYDTTTDFPLKGVDVYLNNSAGGTPIREVAPGNAAVRPNGMSYISELIISEGGTYSGDPLVMYVNENLSGRMASITKDSDRYGKEGVDIPEGAMYIYMCDDHYPLSRVFINFCLGDGTPSDFNVVRHHQYTMHFTLRGLNAADKRIELKTANCYLVDQYHTDYSFHATVMGNGAITPAADANAPAIVPTTLKPASAKVLWEQSDPTGATNAVGDVVKNVRLSNDKLYIHFTKGTKPGNAVIGAFDEAGTLIWSWHIWWPETSPGTVSCHTTANGGRDFYMMDRNLGAFNNNENDVKAYGLLYQWGRKDPFPGATGVSAADAGAATFNGAVTENGYSFSAVDTPTGITVQGAIQNPMTFYCDKGSVHEEDWLQNVNDNLWGNPYVQNVSALNPDLGSKSIYDPCPKGYRLPPQDAWSQATSSNSTWATNGYQLGVGTGSTPGKYFYPAAGQRWGDFDMGMLGNVGSHGIYGSSSPHSYGSTNAGILSFGGGNVFPQDNSSRAYSVSVRCMQEL